MKSPTKAVMTDIIICMSTEYVNMYEQALSKAWNKIHSQMLIVWVYINVNTNEEAIQLNANGKKFNSCWGEPEINHKGICQIDHIIPIIKELFIDENLQRSLGSNTPLHPISSNPPPNIITGVIQLKKIKGELSNTLCSLKKLITIKGMLHKIKDVINTYK